MTFLYVSVLALLFLCTVPAYYMRMTQGYLNEIRKLENEISAFELAKEEMETDLDSLEAEEEALNKERISLVEVDHALPSLGGGPSGSYSGPIDYLLKNNRITEEDVRKAKEYKEGSGSAYDLEEVLVMIDVITSAEMKTARERSKG